MCIYIYTPILTISLAPGQIFPPHGPSCRQPNAHHSTRQRVGGQRCTNESAEREGSSLGSKGWLVVDLPIVGFFQG